MVCVGRIWGAFVLSVCAVAVLGAEPADAQETPPAGEMLDTQGQLVLSRVEDQGLVLGLVGLITAQSVADFLNITRNRDIALFVLGSPGGDLDAGIAIAELVALRGLVTQVPEEASCASACALIFFAGKERILDGRLGVHQFRTVASSLQDEGTTQARVGRLLELLNSFDTPPMAIEKLAITGPECLYVFDARHADMMQRGSLLAGARIEGRLECPDTGQAAPNRSGAAQPVPTPSVPDLSVRELRREVQRQLNRVGCTLGTPDGIIGPRSQRALRSFSEEQGLRYDAANFDRPAFLAHIEAITVRVCPKPPKATAPDLAGNWSLSARCTSVRGTIRGALTAKRRSPGRYSLFYHNNVGETGSGTIVQNGRRASVTVRWNHGNTTTSHMTVNGAGTRMSGNSSNGCVFTAWR